MVLGREEPTVTPRIITSFVYPPIPIRTCDWAAHVDGDEESGRCGYGETEEQAIQDLKDGFPELFNEETP